ncbi:hypothetical protein SAMN05421882_100962 [Nitrosomonas communis]|uniref:Uncharacterized protein n=1 Tax=Nitrosomonas communis TaxID=44574 RepID=A0A1H2T2T6_9PROT|nr:hypothetical protein SAMN05421882_100962 [Nitrosomonas communis]
MRFFRFFVIAWGSLLGMIFVKPILAFCKWESKREEERELKKNKEII